MIEAKNLTMRYGPTVAVDQVSFQVGKGEVVGLLGPNGAGKTTLMRILTTYIVPAEGTATLGGFDIGSHPLEVRRLIGYLPETAPLYLDMRVDEYLKFIADARGLSGSQATDRTGWVIEATALKRVLKNNINELSKGYRQRLGLAQALIHDPQVLILDEPTSGLDPLQIIDIRNLIRQLAREKTIIFSTHIMQEASAVSDRIIIINYGKKIADGTIGELEEQAMKYDRSRLTVQAPRGDIEKALSGVRSAMAISYIGEENGFVTFELRSRFGDPLWQEVDQIIKQQGWPLKSFGAYRISLEDTFLELTRSTSRKEGKTSTAAPGGMN